MATQQPPPPQSASRYHALSALIAARAVTEARKAKPSGLAAIAKAVWTHQITQAVAAERAVAEMLIEQEIDAAADALLNSTAFTTDVRTIQAMVDSARDDGFERLVESIVQDAGRAAESVATAVRPDIYHVRYLSPPSCGRCAILAGRIYRYSEGFKRHPNCDCVMLPTTVAAPYAQAVESGVAGGATALMERGLITDLSKADTRAIRDGADPARVINVRRKAAGLQESGRVLARAGRPTPEGIYRMSNSRTEAVDLLARFGYVT